MQLTGAVVCLPAAPLVQRYLDRVTLLVVWCFSVILIIQYHHHHIIIVIMTW